VDVNGATGVEIASVAHDVEVTGASRVVLQALAGVLAANSYVSTVDIGGQTGVTIQSETGGISIGTAPINSNSACDTGGVCQGAIDVGTAGQRALTIGNALTNTALNLNAGSGNMKMMAVSGSLEIDADTGVAVESSGAGIAIGADNVNGAISVGVQGVRMVSVGSSAATAVNLAAGTIGSTYGAGELVLKDADSYEIIELSGAASAGSDVIAMRAAEFYLLDGTTTATDMPGGSDGSVVLRITDTDGTVLTDSAISITASSSVAIAAGAGNMAVAVTSGTYSLDADVGIAIETKSDGPVSIAIDGGACSGVPSATTEVACTSGVFTPTTGQIKLGTDGQRTIAVGNANANTGLTLSAGSGNLGMSVTGGAYTLDADLGIAIETKTDAPISLGTDGGVCSGVAGAITAAACTSGVFTPTTGAIKIGTDGQRTISVGNVDSNSALRLKAGSGNMAVTVDGGTYSLDAGGNVAMESSGGTIVIGDDAVNQAMKFGTNGQRTISIGNSEANSGLVVKAGSGNMAVSVTSGSYNLDADTGMAMETKTDGPLTVGGDGGVCSGVPSATTEVACTSGIFTPTTGAIKLGSDGQRTIIIGNSNANTALVMKAGTTYHLDADTGVAVETKTDGPIAIGTDGGVCSAVPSATTIAQCPSGVWTPTSGAINVGTDGSRVVSVGNANSDTKTYIKGGSLGIDISATGTSPYGVGGGVASNVVISAGNLGIGQSTPTYALHIGSTGDTSGAVANAWNTFSDRRLKKDIINLPSATFDSVMALRPVSFKWNATDRADIGFIAQEVETVLPHIVSTGPDGLKTVDYPRIGVFAVKALQQLNDRLEVKMQAQEAKMQAQEVKMQAQEAQMQAQEAQIQAQEAKLEALVKLLPAALAP
jgi:hypothetical protein